jgi:hypothetical protein
MSAEDVFQTILLIGPGFVALKVFQLFGARRKRSEWEWTVWSVIAGVLIAALALGLSRALTLPDVAARFAVAIVAGAAGALLWRVVRKIADPAAIGFRQELTDSVWDLVMEEASRRGRPLEVAVVEGETETLYVGKIAYFGYEDAEAQPWLYLNRVLRRRAGENTFERLEDAAGVLLHRDEIKRVRVLNDPA